MRGLMCGLVLLVAVGCGQSNGTKKAVDEKAAPEKPAVAGLVDLQVLSQDYRANQAAGDEKYTGRQMTAEGSMKKLEKMESGDYRMRFEYFVDGFNFREGNVLAFFPASELTKLTKFEYRSPVVFTGRCDGLVKGDVVIRDCRITTPPK